MTCKACARVGVRHPVGVAEQVNRGRRRVEPHRVVRKVKSWRVVCRIRDGVVIQRLGEASAAS